MELNTKFKRVVLFLGGCVVARGLLAYYAYHMSPFQLKILSIVAIIISIGFITIYLNDWRKSGSETFGEPIWWNHLRPFHSFMYFLVALAAFNGLSTITSMLLAIDLLIGLMAFTQFHFL